MRGQELGAYAEEYQRSLADPEGFWAEQARASTGSASRARILDATARRSTAGSPTRRSTPATTRSTGTSSRGHGDRTALIYDSAVTGTQRTYTYAELLERVAAFAGALRALGVGRG